MADTDDNQEQTKKGTNPFHMTAPPMERQQNVTTKTSAAFNPNHMNNVAQKAKVILPTALWILLIFASICFLTLLASLNRTLSTLDTLVELEEEQADLLSQLGTLSSTTPNHEHKRPQQNHLQSKKHQHKPLTISEPKLISMDGPNVHVRFGDDSARPMDSISGLAPSSSWFAFPSWASLEPRHHSERLENQHQPEQLLISVESDGDSSNPSEMSSALDFVMKHFLGLPMLGGQGGFSNWLSNKNKQQKNRDEDQIERISANIDNVNINFNSNSDAKRKNKKFAQYTSSHQEEKDSLEKPLDDLINELMFDTHDAGAASEQHLASSFIPARQPPIGIMSSPLASLLLPPGLARSPAMFKHKQHEDKFPNIDEPQQLVITAFGDFDNVDARLDHPDASHVRPSSFHGSSSRPTVQRHEPYELPAPILFTNSPDGQSAKEHRKLHDRLQTLTSGPSMDEQQQEAQWHSLSKDMADSILQSFLPSNFASASDKWSDSEPESLVIVDGKALGPNESKKFMASLFEPSSKLSSGSPIEQVGDLINTMLGGQQASDEQHLSLPTANSIGGGQAVDKPKGQLAQDGPQTTTTETVPSLSSSSQSETSPKQSTSAPLTTSEESSNGHLLSVFEPASVIGDMMGMLTLPQFSGGQPSPSSLSSNDVGSSSRSSSSASQESTTLASIRISSETTRPMATVTTSAPTSPVETSRASTTSTSVSQTSTMHDETLDPPFRSSMSFSRDQMLLKDATSSTTTSTPNSLVSSRMASLANIDQSTKTSAPDALKTTTPVVSTTTTQQKNKQNDAPTIEVVNTEEMSEAPAIDLAPFAKSVHANKLVNEVTPDTTTTSTNTTAKLSSSADSTSSTNAPDTTKSKLTHTIKDRMDESSKTVLQRADDFIERSLLSLKRLF